MLFPFQWEMGGWLRNGALTWSLMFKGALKSQRISKQEIHPLIAEKEETASNFLLLKMFWQMSGFDWDCTTRGRTQFLGQDKNCLPEAQFLPATCEELLQEITQRANLHGAVLSVRCRLPYPLGRMPEQWERVLATNKQPQLQVFAWEEAPLSFPTVGLASA